MPAMPLQILWQVCKSFWLRLELEVKGERNKEIDISFFLIFFAGTFIGSTLGIDVGSALGKDVGIALGIHVGTALGIHVIPSSLWIIFKVKKSTHYRKSPLISRNSLQEQTKRQKLRKTKWYTALTKTARRQSYAEASSIFACFRWKINIFSLVTVAICGFDCQAGLRRFLEPLDFYCVWLSSVCHCCCTEK